MTTQNDRIEVLALQNRRLLVCIAEALLRSLKEMPSKEVRELRRAIKEAYPWQEGE